MGMPASSQPARPCPSRRALVAGAFGLAAGVLVAGGSSQALAASVFEPRADEGGAASGDAGNDAAASPTPDDSAGTAGTDTSHSAGYLAAYQLLRDTIVSCVADEVDLSAYNVNETDYLAALHDLAHDPATCHYLSGQYVTRGFDGEERQVVSFQLTYRIEGEQLATYEADLGAALDSLVAQVDPSASEYDKALFVYDWLQANVAYDQDVVNPNIQNTVSRTPLGALAYGKAVCSGYTSAFALAMERLGIASEYIVSDDMSHSWNMTRIDGGWYYSDVTWDDTDDDSSPQRFYFMVGEQTLARDHWGWTPAHEAPADLPRPGYVRLSPADLSLADAILQAVYTYPGWIVDMLDFNVDSATLDATFSQLGDGGQFWGIAFAWSWRCNEAGTVIRLYVEVQ